MKRWLWMAVATIAMGVGSALAGPAPVSEGAAAQIMARAGEHRLLVLGEYHGTAEIPVLVAELMERYSRDGAAVRLGLELPMSENIALARYLRSDGAAPAQHALRTTKFWTVKDDQHDGRRSRDMLALVEAVRLLREQGRDVGVAGYDVEPDSTLDGDVRDAEMAAHLRQQFNALPVGARMLVLTGNVHAMRKRSDDAPAEMQQRPMASHLQDLPLYSVRLEALRGAFWACAAPCRALPLQTRTHAPPQTQVNAAADRQYDLWMWLPEFSVGTLMDRAK